MDLDNNELTHLPRGINTMINLQTLLVDFNKDRLTAYQKAFVSILACTLKYLNHWINVQQFD